MTQPNAIIITRVLSWSLPPPPTPRESSRRLSPFRADGGERDPRYHSVLDRVMIFPEKTGLGKLRSHANAPFARRSKITPEAVD
ncbi:hypothetical protein VTH06DRAFT_5518 [Thermothelomyces fergusii]